MPDFEKTSERRERIYDAIVKELEAQDVLTAGVSQDAEYFSLGYFIGDTTINMKAVVKAIDYALFAGPDGVIVEPELPNTLPRTGTE